VTLDEQFRLLPHIAEAQERIERKLDALLSRIADREDEWLSPAAHARAEGVSVDTTMRRIERGELEVREISRTPLRGRDGAQLVDPEGRPRWRRTLRVRLARPVTKAEVGSIAREMRA